MFLNFSEEAQKCLILAKEEMMKLNHPYVGSEHLILAILSYKNSVSRRLFKYDITYDKFRNEIINIIGKGKIESKWFLFTPLLKKVIQNSVFDSKEKKEKNVSIEQLFLSLLEEGEGVAIRLLIGMNIDVELIYKDFSSNFIVRKNKKDKKLLIKDFAVNFNKKVLSNEIDPVVGRDNEVNRIIEVLCRRTKNNPLLVGEAGVGKTAIVEELSRRIVEGDVPKLLQNKEIYSISVASLVSGTKYRGEFEERINKILKELEEENNIILFIDEVHTIVGAGGAEGAIDASNILKPSMARGKIKIIGATTNNEYIKYIEKDKALDRRFQKIQINEPDKEDTITMLRALKGIYEGFHGVLINDDIVDYIVEMGNNYMTDKRNPDKSIDILDEVCSMASINSFQNTNSFKNNNKLKKIIKEKNNAIKNQDFVMASKLKNKQNKLETEINQAIFKNNINDNRVLINKEMVDKIIENKTNIPIFNSYSKGSNQLKLINKVLCNSIIGQDEVINNVISVTKKILYGFKKNNPYSFLFIGPTGVGKTLFVKKYASTLYGKDNFIRIDMSEYKEASSISKLLGSSPGYVGYDDNNSVLDKVRSFPYSVILLDEVEKASQAVLKLFLQILDEGIIHDSLGREINFKNCIIFMTSNLGATSNSLGFNDLNTFNQELRDFFSLEFLNRIDKICAFKPLSEKNIKRIINNELKKMKLKYKGINIILSEKKVKELILKTDYTQYGARRVEKVIEEEIESNLINEIIEGKSLVTL